MDADAITEEFLRLQKGDLEITSYLVVKGAGGVGKTFLLNRLRRLLEANGVFFVSVDSDVESDVVTVAASLCQQILHRGYAGHYATRLQALASSQLHKSGVSEHPIGADSSVADLPLFQSLGEDIKTHRPEVLPSAEAVELLALALREICSKQKVTLFTDLSVVSTSLEIWLRRLVDTIQSPLLIVVACRRDMSHFWPQGNGLASFVFLSPLQVEAASQYLRQYAGIEDDATIREILDLTEGYPLFLTHAANFWKQNQTTRPGSKSRTLRRTIASKVRQCLFREVVNSETQELVRYSALCRTATRDALLLVANKRLVEKHYHELLQCSFMVDEPPGIGMLSILRRALLEEWRLQSPEVFRKANAKLLRHHEQALHTLNAANRLWAVVGILYHQLCLDEGEGLDRARRMLFEAEERYDISGYRAILVEITQFPYRGPQSQEWLRYWSASLARMECRWDDAEHAFRGLAESGSTAILRGYGHYGLAQVLKLKGNWDSAERHFRIALDVFRSSHDKQLRFLSLVLQGNVLARQHLWSQALNVLNESLGLVSERSDGFELFLVHLNLGKLYRSQGNWKPAIERFSRALEFAEQLDNVYYVANIYLELGKLHRAQENLDEAVEFLQRCLRLRRELGDKLGEAICLHSLGSVWMRKGELEQARECYQDSLRIKDVLADQYGLAKSLNGLGHVERLMGNWQTSVDFYKQALELFNRIGNQPKASRVLCRLGMTYASQGLWEEASSYLEQSRTTQLLSRDRQGVSESLLELGRVQDRQGNSEDALESFRLSIKFARESSSIGRELPPHVALVRTLFKLNRSTGAIQAAQEARILAKQYNRFQQLAQEYFAWGDDDCANGSYEVAFFCYAEVIEALQDVDEDVSEYCSRITKQLRAVAMSAGDEVANHLSQQVLQYWESFSSAESLMRSAIAAEFHRSGKEEKSLDLLEGICQRLTQALRKEA